LPIDGVSIVDWRSTGRRSLIELEIVNRQCAARQLAIDNRQSAIGSTINNRESQIANRQSRSQIATPSIRNRHSPLRRSAINNRHFTRQ